MTAPAAEWPAAAEIARIIVAAAGEENDDPVLVAEGGFAPRSRVYAYLALAHQFPTVPRKEAAAKVGAKIPNLPAVARCAVLRRGGLTWFDLVELNRIREACGWSPMTADEADKATRVPAPLEPTPPVVAAERIEAWRSGAPIEPAKEAPAPVDVLPPGPRNDSKPAIDLPPLPRSIATKPPPARPDSSDAPSDRVEKADKPAPGPTRPPIAALHKPAYADHRAPAAAEHINDLKDSRSAPALRPLFAAAGAIDLDYRPDAPATARGVDVVTADLMGDPAPGRSALA